MNNISEEEKAVWGDVDFIEEGTPFSTEPLEYQDATELDISESESKGSKWKLIGKVKGCMAPIGVYSRNHRIYENDHWIKVLRNPDLQERLANRRLLGMPSHMQKNIDDEDFREGRISHVVSVLEVRKDNNGKPFLYGEFDILDTPAGRILKAMYEGGAGIYVSTRAAGRLESIPNDPVNRRVRSDSYYLGSIDCVLNPGFIQARPAFEAIPTFESSVSKEKEVSESQINELNNSTVESDLKKREDQLVDAEAHAKEDPKVAAEAKKKFENAVNLAQKRADRNDEILDQDKNGNPVHYKNESEEIATLRSQIDQLAKILEKVVDDVYEEEPVEEAKEQKKENKLTKAAIPAFLQIMAESNISDESMLEIIDLIKGGLQ